jgi:hypothetical protein
MNTYELGSNPGVEFIAMSVKTGKCCKTLVWFAMINKPTSKSLS